MERALNRIAGKKLQRHVNNCWIIFLIYSSDSCKGTQPCKKDVIAENLVSSQAVRSINLGLRGEHISEVIQPDLCVIPLSFRIPHNNYQIFGTRFSAVAAGFFSTIPNVKYAIICNIYPECKNKSYYDGVGFIQ